MKDRLLAMIEAEKDKALTLNDMFTVARLNWLKNSIDQLDYMTASQHYLNIIQTGMN